MLTSGLASIAEEVLSKTRGKGLDVILSDSSSSASTERCLADFGRLVRVEEAGAPGRCTLESATLDKCTSVLFCDMSKVVELRPGICKK